MSPFSMALRNIGANRRRSLVTVLLCTVTTGLLVFSTAFMDGSHNQMIRNAVEVYPGYLQVTQQDFRETPSYENLLFEADRVAEILAGNSAVAVFAPRFETFVLFSSERQSVGGMLAGIEPEAEAQLSRLKQSLATGEYLSADDTNAVYLGRELAKKLKIGLGDQLSFIGTGADYSFAADTLRVKGIFQTGLFEFDARSAFVNKAYLDEILVSRGLATHFVVLPADRAEAQKLAASLQEKLPAEYRAESWQQIMAGLVEAMEIDSIFGYITLAIIFLVIFFVVMIYTLLAVFARVREIGILRAIGSSPARILVMLLGESVLLALVSVLAGGLLGGLLAYYFHIHPMEFSGYEEQFRQYGLIASAMPTDFSLLTILRDMALMFVLAVASTLYPIFKVNGYKPIEAIHHV